MESLTVAELRKMARDANIIGRSSMSKAKLILALAGRGPARSRPRPVWPTDEQMAIRRALPWNQPQSEPGIDTSQATVAPGKGVSLTSFDPTIHATFSEVDPDSDNVAVQGINLAGLFGSSWDESYRNYTTDLTGAWMVPFKEWDNVMKLEKRLKTGGPAFFNPPTLLSKTAAVIHEINPSVLDMLRSAYNVPF